MSREKRLIVTISVGEEAARLRRFSEALLRSYAHSCQAQFDFLEPSNLSESTGKPTYEKFQIGRLLEVYDRVLFVDIDILVRPGAPDVFEFVPPGDLGVVSVDRVFSRVVDEKRLSQKILGEIDWGKPYFNAGVMLFSRIHRPLLDEGRCAVEYWHSEKLRRGEVGKNDQTLFNYFSNSLDYSLYDMGCSFNYTRAWRGWHTRFKHWFIHYAGLVGNREWQMRRDFRILMNPALSALHRSVPAVTWLGDRLHGVIRSYGR